MVWKHWEALFIERPRWIVRPGCRRCCAQGLHETGARQGRGERAVGDLRLCLFEIGLGLGVGVLGLIGIGA